MTHNISSLVDEFFELKGKMGDIFIKVLDKVLYHSIV